MEMNRRMRFAGVLAAVLLVAACTSDGGIAPPRPDGPLFGATEPGNDVDGQCLGDDVFEFGAGFFSGHNGLKGPTDVNCTANDIEIATAAATAFFDPAHPDADGDGFVALAEGEAATCIEGEDVTFKMELLIRQNSNSVRGDIGLWIATDGKTVNAPDFGGLTGQCNHYNIPGTLATSLGAPLENADGDQCAGMLGTKNATFTLDIGELTVPCTPNENDKLAIAGCSAWNVPGGDFACPAVGGANDNANGFRKGTMPNNSAKCNCDPFEVNITVAKSAEIRIDKVCVPTNDPGKFNLVIDESGDPDFYQQTDALCGGTTGFQEVGAGTSADPGATHLVNETAGTGTNLSNYTTTWSCRLGETGTPGGVTRNATTGAIDVLPDQQIICTVTNTGLANVTIKKVTVPAATAGTFGFTSTFPGVGNDAFNLVVSGGTPEPTKVISGVIAGTARTVTETVPDGWDLTSRVCTGAATWSTSGANAISVTPATGESITCTFTNTRRATLTVTKDQLGSLADMTWSFEVRNTGGSNANVWASGSVLGDGTVSFSCTPDPNAKCMNVGGVANLTPGGYAVCEVGVPAGWTTVLGGTQYSPAGESDAHCVDITLAAGASGNPTGVNNPVTNEPPPEGDQRTIGYWRNWSSCSKGNQYAKAEASGFEKWTLDQNLPQTIGDLVVDNCEDGVNILSKRDLDGANRASDAAYGLAAQLLAAKLNVAAGAGTCTAGNTAITQAQALLAAIDFDGTGSYLTAKSALSSSPYTTGTFRSVALELAGILDQYNNGDLCGV